MHQIGAGDRKTRAAGDEQHVREVCELVGVHDFPPRDRVAVRGQSVREAGHIGNADKLLG